MSFSLHRFSFRFQFFIETLPSFHSSGISTPTALDVTDEGLIVIVDKIASFTAFIINEFGEIVRCFECKNYIVEPSDVTIYGKRIMLLRGKRKVYG